MVTAIPLLFLFFLFFIYLSLTFYLCNVPFHLRNGKNNTLEKKKKKSVFFLIFCFYFGILFLIGYFCHFLIAGEDIFNLNSD